LARADALINIFYAMLEQYPEMAFAGSSRDLQKNLAAGRGERGTEIIHFERAFHGRSGYTLSLTNTDPRKIAYFAKFPWPRIISPSLDFSLPPAQREAAVVEKEKRALQHIRGVLEQKAADIAAIIIEPIQAEGGDNHFRGEFLAALKQLALENEALLVFDEVQSGVGLTGRFWAHQHFGVEPDLLPRQEDADLRHDRRRADRPRGDTRRQPGGARGARHRHRHSPCSDRPPVSALYTDGCLDDAPLWRHWPGFGHL
jgi:hypothetical protein